jgi:SAM-dependent methyltransferase
VSQAYDPTLFEAFARIEPESFWFRARNRLIVSTLQRYFPGLSSLLEVGCGTGFVLAAIRAAFPSARLVGGELFAEGRALAERRVPDAQIVELDAERMPFSAEFDVLGCFDVLEHVPGDEAALAQMHRALRPSGGLVVLVPQHPWLWSSADEFAHHVRRYERHELTKKVERAGFRVLRETSFVSLLLPALVVSRLSGRVLRRDYDPWAELRPGRILNRGLERLLDAERRLIERGVSFPAGGSRLVVAEKIV